MSCTACIVGASGGNPDDDLRPGRRSFACMRLWALRMITLPGRLPLQNSKYKVLHPAHYSAHGHMQRRASDGVAYESSEGGEESAYDDRVSLEHVCATCRAARERVCCLLVLDSVTSTPQWIRQPKPPGVVYDVCVFVCKCVLGSPRASQPLNIRLYLY